MKSTVERLIHFTLGGGLPAILFAVALLAGLIALQLTPREEEPQIVVPMVDVSVAAPGLSAPQVERQVTTALEKLLAQIPGIEHIYSSSSTGQATATLRFHVGEDREDSLLNAYNKLYSNQDLIPPAVTEWMVEPVEVDDVPILVMALWSEEPRRYSDYELRRLAEELSIRLQGIPQTSEVKVAGGRPRRVQVLFDPEALASRKTTALELVSAIQRSNQLQSAGRMTLHNESIELQSGDYFRSAEELESSLVNVVDGNPVFLKDVARVVDGPAETENYTWLDFAPAHLQAAAQADGQQNFPMVTISVAKQRGANAVTVAEDVHQAIDELRAELFPQGVSLEVIRDYGQTADEKVGNLIASLGFAILTVVIFLGIFLGWRAAAVVALAVPVCYGITLALDMLFGYSINRVTLFALILALGLLVDDPITGVDNISRFVADRGNKASFHDKIVAAMSEIRVPLLMSTLTIVLAFIPLAFITGMMGPYMAPMAFNVPVSVITSTLVAFLITPWLTSKFLKPQKTEDASAEANGPKLTSLYQRVVEPLLANRKRAKLTLWLVLGLFMLTAALPLFRLVPLKLLPFDNKNEVQVVIDMPESASLEATAAMAKQVSTRVSRLPEIQAIAAYVGTASPMDFNGMVRGYYQRQQPHLADLRITLADKKYRQHQSHAIVLRMRELLRDLNRDGVQVKVVEVPPGPPVLSTLVAELYAEQFTDYSALQDAATTLMQRLEREPHVVEVDSTVPAAQSRSRFIVDKQKAALSGIATEDINQTLALANRGFAASTLQLEEEVYPLPIELRLPLEQRSSHQDLLRLQVKGQPGVTKTSSPSGLDIAPQPLVAIGELGSFSSGRSDTVIHHKDLRPVVYVTAELSGRTPAEVIADLHADRREAGAELSRQESSDWQGRTFFSSGGGDEWQLPAGVSLNWGGEGEWRITIDVFRDMGIAFAFALAAIFMVLRVQTRSSSIALIIMSAIPLTVIGIMPGFWLLNLLGERQIAGAPDPTLFTATAMIGMIALAGIVVRNSLILVEFIAQAQREGLALKDALLQAGAVRARPVLLTAGTTMLGNLVIILDPVFSGLALAIIFGIVASTVFTLVVIPVVYYLVFDRETAAVPTEQSA